MLRKLLIGAALAAIGGSVAASAATGRSRQESVSTSVLLPGVPYTREVDFTSRGPIVLDVSRAGDDGSLLEGELEEFVEALEDLDESSEKQAVLEHLRGGKGVVAAQLLWDIAEGGHRASQARRRVVS